MRNINNDMLRRIADATGLTMSLIIQLSAFNANSLDESVNLLEMGYDLGTEIIEQIKKDAKTYNLL